MKVLILDIETAPNLVHVWGLWNQNVGMNQILASGYVLCWAAKWLGQEEIMFTSIQQGKTQMLKKIHKLLDQADAVIHYNGTKFDIPTLNKEFIAVGLRPPSPYKQIDLLKTVRKQFKFPSNKLDYIAQALNLGNKVRHEGHELWVKCMNKDPHAWGRMEEYNKHDVRLLERVYQHLKAWVPDHANYSLYERNGLVCTNCGSEHYQRRGFAYTKACKYERFQCTDCGHWFRGGKSMAPPPDGKFISL